MTLAHWIVYGYAAALFYITGGLVSYRWLTKGLGTSYWDRETKFWMKMASGFWPVALGVSAVWCIVEKGLVNPALSTAKLIVGSETDQ